MKPRISFEAPADESFGPARELLCSVWPLASVEAQPSISPPVLSNGTVLVGPLGHGQFPATLELPAAGDYLVDLGYPNGASLRTAITVAEGQQYRLIVPSQRPAVRPSSSVTSRTGLVPRVISAALKTMHFREPDLEVRLVGQAPDVSLQGLREFAANATAPSADAEMLEVVEDAGLDHSIRLENQHVENFRQGYRRKWLIVAAGFKHPTMVAYPVGWLDQGPDAFSLSMRRKAMDRTEATKWSVELKLMNPVFGSLIEHLTRRDVVSSNEISQSARGKAIAMLYEKEENPFAAAAGAYLLALGQGELGSRDQWMANLTNWFDWLPDGPIAFGWASLRQGKSGSQHWDKGRELMLLACSRGLPYFTIGLHVLVEALTLLSMADPDDDEVRAALAAARAADVASVRNEPFTTLQVSRFLGLPVL